ncbi:MAG TPA: hypothetical protein VGF24_22810 [Vicinamibacterales bacterium]
MSRMLIALEVVALTGTLVTTVHAQPTTTSFDQLRFILEVGEKITVDTATGERTKGRVLDVSASSVGLRVKGQRRELHEIDVVRIVARRRDSVVDSALVGGIPPAVVAAGFASVEGKGVATLAGLLWGGMGAGLGAGVDALFKRRDVVYLRALKR